MIFANWNTLYIDVDADNENSHYYQFLVEAHKEQQVLGYTSFMSGFLSKKWALLYTLLVRDTHNTVETELTEIDPESWSNNVPYNKCRK